MRGVRIQSHHRMNHRRSTRCRLLSRLWCVPSVVGCRTGKRRLSVRLSNDNTQSGGATGGGGSGKVAFGSMTAAFGLGGAASARLAAEGSSDEEPDDEIHPVE